MHAFVLDRNERRNITKGQKAMAHAILFPEAPTAQERGAEGGRGNKGDKAPAATAGAFGDTLLKQARAVLRHTPELAEKVRDHSNNGARLRLPAVVSSRQRMPKA